jgi:hypothetical protein
VRTECKVLGGGYLTCIGEEEGWVVVGDRGGGGHEGMASLNEIVEERLPDLPILSVILCAPTHGYFERLPFSRATFRLPSSQQ